MAAGQSDHVAAQHLVDRDAGEVDRHAATGRGRVPVWSGAPAGRGCARAGRAARSPPPGPAASVPSSSVPVTTVPKPVQGEDAIHGQVRAPAIDRSMRLVERRVERCAQVVQSCARRRRARDQWRGVQGCAGEGRAHVLTDQLQPLGVHQIALGEGHDAAGDAEQIQDIQVLARLGHHPFVGGDHQQGDVDAAGASQHMADEALVSRHVDDGGFAAGGQSQPGEAQFNRHAPPLLLGQAIGVDPCQGMDERTLAMVDMAGCTDDMHSQSIAD